MKDIKIQLDLKKMIGFRLAPSIHRGASRYAAKISEKTGPKVGVVKGSS